MALLPSLCPGEDGAEPEWVPWVCLGHQMPVVFLVWGWTGGSWTWVVALLGLEYRSIPETVRGKLQELKEDIHKTRRQQQRLAGRFAA